MLEKAPRWAVDALQGITYWIGHRRCIYPHHPMPEGALVAELCNLICANLRTKEHLQLKCEVQYSEILKSKKLPAKLMNGRADLVVEEKENKNTGSPTPKFIIEVKRAKSLRKINEDLQRLAAVRHAHGSVRAFLFVIGEAKRPKWFVDDDGNALSDERPIPNPEHSIPIPESRFRVRRVLKAAHSFSSVGTAHYACLIEVLPHSRRKFRITR
jgi:hypothetical protein